MAVQARGQCSEWDCGRWDSLAHNNTGPTPRLTGEIDAVQDGTDTQTQALAAAALLERWADAIPMWDPEAGERWDGFADRRYQAELTLERRLRQLPGCRL